MPNLEGKRRHAAMNISATSTQMAIDRVADDGSIAAGLIGCELLPVPILPNIDRRRSRSPR
jgi:hypothetical protein